MNPRCRFAGENSSMQRQGRNPAGPRGPGKNLRPSQAKSGNRYRLAGQALVRREISVRSHFFFELVRRLERFAPRHDEHPASSASRVPAAAVIERNFLPQTRVQHGFPVTRLDKVTAQFEPNDFQLKPPPRFGINGGMRFIAFDLETTGTVPGVDQIVEIGAVRFENGLPSDIFVTLIDPKRPIPPGASAVNNITDDMVKGQPLIETILPAFAEFCAEDPLIAHNASFDAQFLTSDIKKHELSAPRGLILDTLPIARKVFPGLPNYKLTTLIQHLKILADTAHRAHADAQSCGHLFHHMLQRISVAGRGPTLEQLVNLTGKPELKFPQIVRQPKQMDLFGGL